MAESATIFISYSHQDKAWLKRLRVHLDPLQRDYNVKVVIWEDTKIEAGDKWHDEIKRAIGRAQIAVLLISAHFFHSDYIVETELPPLLLAAENKGTAILPLVLSDSRFTRTPALAPYQAVNDPKRPLATLSKGKQQAVLNGLSARIEGMLVRISKRPPLAANAVGLAKATKLIGTYASSRQLRIGAVRKSRVSPFGTHSYHARVKDQKGVIYLHADGKLAGQLFEVRKGIGWFYEWVLRGAGSALGLPTSDEGISNDILYPTSRFEGGYIEWSPKTKVARAVINTSRGDQTLVERRL